MLTLGPAGGRGAAALRRAASERRTPSCSPPTAATGTRSARRGRSRRRSAISRRRTAPFDLILFGNESADSGGFQVGIRVAHALGRPMVNGAKGITVADGGAEIWREADAGREVVRAAAAGRGRRQGGHQPAPLPDDEGPPGVEEGRGRERDRGGGARRPADGPAAHAGRAGVEDRRARHRASMRRPRWSTCSSRLGVLEVIARRRRARPRHDRAGGVRSADRRDPPRCTGDDTVEALTIGAAADALVERARGVRRRRRAPGAPRAARRLRPRGVGRGRRPGGAHARARPPSLATGTDRGNEVLAQAAAAARPADGRQLHRVRAPATRSR